MLKKYLKLGLLVVTMGISSLLCAATVNTGSDTQVVNGQKLGFISSNPITFQQLISKKDLVPQPISGYLSLPKINGKQKVPVVVLVPGSGGLKPWYNKYVKNLNDHGIATFALDSFTTRGITKLSSNQAQLPVPMLVADAYNALQFLAKEPAIDASKIAIMGWSLGGLVSMTTAFADLSKHVVDSKLRYAAHVSFYPACNLIYPNDRLDGAPWLYLHGSGDDYTHPMDCVSLLENIRNSTAIQAVIYPNAYHGFDEPQATEEWLPNVQNPKNCHGVLANDWSLTEKTTGLAINGLADYQTAFNGCMLRGAHVGFSQSASDDAMWQVTNFLQHYLMQKTTQ